MPTEITGRVYSYQQNSAGGWLAVKVEGGKVIRFRTDDGPWKLNEEVIVSVRRVGPTPQTSDVLGSILKGFSIDN